MICYFSNFFLGFFRFVYTCVKTWLEGEEGSLHELSALTQMLLLEQHLKNNTSLIGGICESL